MKQYSVSVIIHPTDLSIGENVTGLIEACGDVDIVVNNAGSVPGGGVEDVDETRWRAAWDLKVFGYINNGVDIPPHEGAQKGCYSQHYWQCR